MLDMTPMMVSRALRCFVTDGILRKAKLEEIPERCRKGMRPKSIYYWFLPQPQGG